MDAIHMTAETFFIGGTPRLASPDRPRHDLESPITEEPLGKVALGTREDVEAAVAAARAAFETFGLSSVEERIGLLEALRDAYAPHVERLAQLVTTEIGAPISFSRSIHAGSTPIIIEHTIKALRDYPFSSMTEDGSLLLKEPIGVCALITPWNFPIHQIICKVAGALAAGCTMVLKPSELSPFSADAFARIVHEAGLPPGVFNMVQGDGATVGTALSSHPDVDMVSFTGSTRAGILVAKAAADSVKRVHQELGGKSAAIVLPDADIEAAVAGTLGSHLSNTGQACVAWTRLLVHEDQQDEVVERTRAALEAIPAGDPFDAGTRLGAMATKAQFDKVQSYIEIGIREGARLVTGGTGRPNPIQRGYFVRPTLFADVGPDMAIAQEEIFGPVLSVIPYRDEEHAIEIANGTRYGLSGGVFSADLDRARNVARRIRSGMVHLNGAWFDFNAPFGGMKQSGNGREWGRFGLEDFLETKAIMGYRDGIGTRPAH